MFRLFARKYWRDSGWGTRLASRNDVAHYADSQNCQKQILVLLHITSLALPSDPLVWNHVLSIKHHVSRLPIPNPQSPIAPTAKAAPPRRRTPAPHPRPAPPRASRAGWLGAW